MQREDELRKWLMLIGSFEKRAEEDGLLLLSVDLRCDNKEKKVFSAESPFLRFTLRVGQPCFIEAEGRRFSAVYLERSRYSALRFRLYTDYECPDRIEHATVIPLTAKFLSLAAGILSPEASFWIGEGSLLPSFLKLISGGRRIGWKEHASHLSREDGIFIVWGPPGTGKTTYIANKVLQLMSADRSFLVLSSNNAALESFSTAAGGFPLHILNGTADCTTFAKYLLDEGPKLGVYDTVIVDEVSTARIPEILVAALSARCELILIGDYMQLGIVADEESERTPLEEDIFSYLAIPEDPSPECHILKVLKRQNRMRPEIASFISRHFYHGLLENGHLEFRKYSSPLGRLFPKAMEAVDISSLWTCPSVTANSSHVNPTSAVITAFLASAWCRETELSVCVLTPYTAQCELIMSLITDLRVSVSTVHALQGKEADIILLDTVDSFPMLKPGKLFEEPYDEFPSPLDRFINVAVSRAREKFILVSDFQFFRICSRGSVLEHLLDSCNTGKNRLDKVLKYIQSSTLLFGIPGRERKKGYENAWSIRRRFFTELSSAKDSIRYTFYFSDSEQLSRFSPALLRKVSECKRAVTFCYRAAHHPLYSHAFSLTEAWKASHPDVDVKVLPDHAYPYALTFALEERLNKNGSVYARYLWYGVLHTPPFKGRCCPIFRIKCANWVIRKLEYIK